MEDDNDQKFDEICQLIKDFDGEIPKTVYLRYFADEVEYCSQVTTKGGIYYNVYFNILLKKERNRAELRRLQSESRLSGLSALNELLNCGDPSVEVSAAKALAQYSASYDKKRGELDAIDDVSDSVDDSGKKIPRLAYPEP